MRRRGKENGEGRAGCVFWILILVVVGIVGARVIPVKIATAQLQDHMIELAQLHAWQNGEYFARSIYEKGRELDLPVEKKRIKVDKRADRVIMDVQLTVPLDFLFYTYVWEIKLHADRDLFLM